jgi:hypothetical protein
MIPNQVGYQDMLALLLAAVALIAMATWTDVRPNVSQAATSATLLVGQAKCIHGRGRPKFEVSFEFDPVCSFPRATTEQVIFRPDLWKVY